MAFRYFGGTVACLGVVGALSAQQPAARLGAPSPLFGQSSRYDSNVEQAGATAPHAYYPAAHGTVATSPPPGALFPGKAAYGGAARPPAQFSGQSVYYAQTPAAGQPSHQPIRADATPPAAQLAPAPAPYAMSAPQPVSACPIGGCGGEVCGDPSCAPCNACDCLCGPPGRVWVSGEWLYWAAKGNSIPPLTTAAPAGTARASAGTLGAPGTSVLYGGRRLGDNFRSGFRLNAGMWLDECQRIGIAGDFFFLGDSRQSRTAGNDGAAGAPIVTRPFINALTGQPDTQLVSFPGVLAGTTTPSSTTSVIGGGASFIRNLCCDPCGRLDLVLGGYRYINLHDDVVITENLTALPGSSVAAGTRFLITDRFQTDNDFHGVPIGLNWERRWSHWYAGVRASVALGVSHQTTTISGSTTIISPGGATQTFPGGLLTQPSNIGTYTNNEFAVVPEIGARLGCQVTDQVRVFAGYNFMYWSSVARAGDQIDLRVNPNQIAPPQPLNGPALPAYLGRKTDYWLHGISLGAEIRF